MKLILEAEGLNYSLLQGSKDVEVDNLVYDSRKDCKNAIFVCMKGSKFDSHKDIDKVVESGAKAIVIEEEIKELPEGVTVISVKSSRKALALLSAAFFEYPIRKMTSIAITGTKGKTTSTYMLKTILEKAGHKIGVIGTNGVLIGDKLYKTLNTTPESFDLHRFFKDMYEEGCKYIIMEVSSQGIMMDRVFGIIFDYAVFTNISKDHIGPDEHKDFEEYLYYKSKLFSQTKTALINIDDKHADQIIENSKAQKLYTYGEKKEADFCCSDISYLFASGFIGVELRIKNKLDLSMKVALPGKFNAINALGMAAVAHLIGVSDEVLKDSLIDIHVAGRMEVVHNSKTCKVIVDYAHNALSMESLLDTLRDYKPKRLVVVFGCGGNRSKDRRYSMGDIAGRKADFSIITADNSRFEKVEDIIADIRSSIEKVSSDFIEIPDRKEAIFYAVKNAKEGDIIAVIGKGHEDYQEIEGVRHHFLDSEVIREAVGSV
jgi:UDP-N-acetylmuramoyl-L-alanyl-D-glutamate--2,6-diaminopimelate ligase